MLQHLLIWSSFTEVLHFLQPKYRDTILNFFQFSRILNIEKWMHCSGFLVFYTLHFRIKLSTDFGQGQCHQVYSITESQTMNALLLRDRSSSCPHLIYIKQMLWIICNFSVPDIWSTHVILVSIQSLRRL